MAATRDLVAAKQRRITEHSMPITIRHEPSLQLVDNAALFAGQGEYLDRQQQHAARQRALDQQAFQNERELQARLYMQAQAQAANQNSQLFQAARQNALMQQQREQQLADMGQQREWRQADLGQQRQWKLADAQQANTWNNERFDRGQQAAWETQSVGAVESRINNQFADMAANRDQFASKEDADEFDSINAQWKALQRDPRLRSSPRAYMEGLAKFQRELEQPPTNPDGTLLDTAEGRLAGIIRRMKPPPPIAEQFDKDVIERNGQLYSRDRSGAFRHIGEVPPDPFDIYLKDNLKHYQREDGTPDYEQAQRDFQAREQFKSQRQAAAREKMEIVGREIAGSGSADDFLMASGAFDPPTPPQAPRKITPKTATNYDEYWGAIPEDEKRQWRKQAFDILKTDGKREGAITADEIAKMTRELVNATNGYDAPAKPAEPEKPSFYERWFGSGSPPAQATTGPPPKKPILPNHINEVPEALREKYRASLVQASSPAQAATFDPGTIFITPDGSIRMVPSAQ